MRKYRIAVLVGAVFLLLFIAGEAVAMYWRTFVPPAVIIGISLSIGVLAGFLLVVKAENNRILRATAGVVYGTCIAAAIILTINYVWADKESSHTEQAEITSKHTEKRDVRRRAGKHYISTGQKRTVYYVTLCFPGGKSRDLQVSASKFSSLRVNSCVSVTMAKGRFGWPVYTDLDLNHSTKKRIKRGAESN